MFDLIVLPQTRITPQSVTELLLVLLLLLDLELDLD